MLFTWLRIIFLLIVIPCRFRSHFEHVLPYSSSVTPLSTKLIGAKDANIPFGDFKTYFGDKTFTHSFLRTKVATPTFRFLDFFRKFQLSIHPLQAQVLDKDQRLIVITSLYVAFAVMPTPPVNMTPPSRSATTADWPQPH